MTRDSIGAIVLAGGQARRMGGRDKALLPWQGRPLISHVVTRLAPQVAGLAVSANGDAARFSFLGLPVLADTLPGYPGPLAGVLAGLRHFAAAGLGHVVSIPCDSPLLPADLIVRLAAGCREASASGALAVSAGRRHSATALWPVTVADELERALVDDGERRVDAMVRRLGFAEVAWEVAGADPFANVNTPDDLARLGQGASQH